MTGEPYIYGSANPVTISDPTGLCGYEFYGDPTVSSIQVPFEPIPGGGVIKIDHFIAASIAGAPGAHDSGNNKTFDLFAPMSQSKVQIIIDLDGGFLTASAAGSCDRNGNGCRSGRAWEFASPDEPFVLGEPVSPKTFNDDLNNLSVIRDDDGLRVQFRALNSRRDSSGLVKAPTIDGVYRFNILGSGSLSYQEKGDPYPSEQVSWTPSGRSSPQELFRYTEKVNIFTRTPRLSTKNWNGLSNDYR